MKYEKILDSAQFGRKWLSNPKVAQILKDTFHFYEGKRYDLISFTIMLNHAHIIILSNNEYFETSLSEHKRKGKTEETFYFLTNIIQDIKKYSANKSNLILNRKGKFWQNESYNHVIRDKKELQNTVNTF